MKDGLARITTVMILVGCAAPPPDVVGRREPIVNGDPGGNAAAVAILNYASDGLCSGSLIAERAVLTAKHCVQEPFASGPSAPSSFVVGIGDDISHFTASLRVQSVYTTPGEWTMSSAGGIDDLVGVDVAILVLQSGVSGVEPFPIRRETHSTLTGEQITAVGYGETPSGQVGVKFTTMGRVQGTDRELIYVGALTCLGDSGGPAITEAGEVAGVVSFGAGSCGTGYGAYNAIFPHLDLIDEALTEAGTCLNDGAERCDGADNDCNDQVDETCTPIGGACTADDECVGLTCRNTSAGQLCTTPCDPLQPDVGCGEGFYCAFADGCGGFCVPLDGERGTLSNDVSCTRDEQCASLHCADPGDGNRRCLDPCRGDEGMCLAGEACAANPGDCGACVAEEILRADRGLGEGCDDDSDCRSEQCFDDGARLYCTRACIADAECPDGYHCRDDVCVAGPRGDIGDPCISNGDCGGETFCVMRAEQRWCTSVCTEDACPEGFSCVAAGGTMVCAPDRGLVGDDCTVNDDCISNICATAGESGGVCTRFCSAEAPCAPGFECRRTGDGSSAVCIEPVREEEGGCSIAARGGSRSEVYAIVIAGLVLGWRTRMRRRRA
jgi:V8-like Glu-specific endopeptidase